MGLTGGVAIGPDGMFPSEYPRGVVISQGETGDTMCVLGGTPCNSDPVRCGWPVCVGLSGQGGGQWGWLWAQAAAAADTHPHVYVRLGRSGVAQGGGKPGPGLTKGLARCRQVCHRVGVPAGLCGHGARSGEPRRRSEGVRGGRFFRRAGTRVKAAPCRNRALHREHGVALAGQQHRPGCAPRPAQHADQHPPPRSASRPPSSAATTLRLTMRAIVRAHRYCAQGAVQGRPVQGAERSAARPDHRQDEAAGDQPIPRAVDLRRASARRV